MDKTALTAFAEKLHQVPEALPKTNPADPQEPVKYKPRENGYYEDLAADIPKILEAEGFPPGTTELSPQEAARLLAGVSNKLDDKNLIGPDGRPQTMSARQAFTTAFHRAMKADGQADNPLKVSELAEQLKAEEFKRNLLNAQAGLAGRTPNPAQAVWTMEKMMDLVTVLMSGDISAIQKEIAKASQPAQGTPVKQFTDAQRLIDVEAPKLAALSALTGDVIEGAFKEIYGTLDETGQRSTKGPISQSSLNALEQRYKTEDGSVHPAVAFFKAQHENGQSLEQVLERVLNNNEKLKAYIADQGLSAGQVKDLKDSLAKAVLGSEKGVQEWKGADGKFWTTAIDKKAAGEWVARDFGVRLNDPSLRFAVDPGAVKQVFNESIKGRGISQIPEVFSQAFAESSGLELDDPQGAEIAQAVRKIAEETMMEVRGYTETGRLQGMHEPLEKSKLPPELQKEYGGRNQQSLFSHLVAQRVEKAIRTHPEWRAAMNGEASGPASGIPLSRSALFNDESFDRGVTVAASKVEIDPASHELKLTGSDGKPVLFIRTDQELGLLQPVRGATGMGFNRNPVSPEALKTALENHTRQGGTIEMRMVALQDGDLKRADVVGVQLVLKDAAGRDVGTTMLGMGGDGGIEMEKSKEQLKALAHGINEPGADNRPKPGVTYAPGISVAPGTNFSIPMN